MGLISRFECLKTDANIFVCTEQILEEGTKWFAFAACADLLVCLHQYADDILMTKQHKSIGYRNANVATCVTMYKAILQIRKSTVASFPKVMCKMTH